MHLHNRIQKDFLFSSSSLMEPSFIEYIHFALSFCTTYWQAYRIRSQEPITQSLFQTRKSENQYFSFSPQDHGDNLFIQH